MSQLLTAVCAFVFLISSAYAQDAGKVITVVGKVSYTTKDGGGAQPLTTGKVLQVGWSIKTEADGKAKLLLTDRTVIDLTPSTEFKVEQFKQDGKDTLNREVSLAVKVGKIRSSVNSPVSEKGKFLIKTKSTTMGVRGTEFIVNSMISNSGDKGVQNVNTQITVIHGKVAVTDLANPNAKPIELTTGKQLVSEVRMNIATGGFVAPSGSSPASSGPKVVDVPKNELDQMKNETTIQDTTFKDSTNIEEKSKSEREAKKEEAEKKEAEGTKEAKNKDGETGEKSEDKSGDKASNDSGKKEEKSDGEKSKDDKGDVADKGGDKGEGGERTADKGPDNESNGDKDNNGKDGGQEQANNSNDGGKSDGGGKDQAGDSKGGGNGNPREPASETNADNKKNDGGGAGPMRNPAAMISNAGGDAADPMSQVFNAISGGNSGPAGGAGPMPFSVPPPKVETRGTETQNANNIFAPRPLPTTAVTNGNVNVTITFTP